MAIFPLHNPYITNYDVLRSATFKAGMILLRDSNGYAVKADRTSLATDSLPEQIGKFLGFASNDHDEINSIILADPDRKSTRLNSSHITISYAVFCLKKKKTEKHRKQRNQLNNQ